MKRAGVAIILLFVIHLNAWASQTVSLRYDEVPVMQLLRATYKDLLGLPYALDGSVITNKAKVSIDLPDLPLSQLQSTVDDILERAGIYRGQLPGGQIIFTAHRLRGGRPVEAPESVSELETVESEPAIELQPRSVAIQNSLIGLENVNFYRPRNRPASELQALVNLLLGRTFPVISGSVVFGGVDEARAEQVLFALEQLDSMPSQIMARALVVEFSDESQEGSTFEAAISALSGRVGLQLGGLITPGENLLRLNFTDFSAIVSAVSGDGRFSVVSSPTLRVADGAAGRVSVGQEVPTLSSTSLDNQGNAVQSVQYRSSGVTLEIKPRLYRDRIELDLLQQISDFVKNQSSGIDSPTMQKRELRTVVSMKSGEMLILGGLNSRKESSSRRGFSFLPRFLSSSSSSQAQSQVLIFLQVEA